MMKRKGKRVLSAEEKWLWAKVSGGYEPLKGRSLFFERMDHEPADLPKALMEVKPQPEEKALGILNQFRSPVKSPESAARPADHVRGRKGGGGRLPPLAQLERKTLRSVRRGTKPVDGVIDLHGMRQTEAHYALLSFLRQSQARGAGLVLVVTGKGEFDSGYHRGPDERGILKRVVPHWLSMPDARAFVVSYGEASMHHGGSGALYVRLRRSRN
jgi:Uncharacterized protein conserved in bacteria